MKFVDVRWVNGFMVYGYTHAGYDGVWWSMKLYKELWHVPMAQTTYIEGL